MKRVVYTSSVSGDEIADGEHVRIRLNLHGRRYVADLSIDEVEHLLVEGLNMESRPARRKRVVTPVAPEKTLDELLRDTAKELGIEDAMDKILAGDLEEEMETLDAVDAVDAAALEIAKQAEEAKAKAPAKPKAKAPAKKAA